MLIDQVNQFIKGEKDKTTAINDFTQQVTEHLEYMNTYYEDIDLMIHNDETIKDVLIEQVNLFIRGKKDRVTAFRDLTNKVKEILYHNGIKNTKGLDKDLLNKFNDIVKNKLKEKTKIVIEDNKVDKTVLNNITSKFKGLFKRIEKELNG